MLTVPAATMRTGLSRAGNPLGRADVALYLRGHVERRWMSSSLMTSLRHPQRPSDQRRHGPRHLRWRECTITALIADAASLITHILRRYAHDRTSLSRYITTRHHMRIRNATPKVIKCYGKRRRYRDRLTQPGQDVQGHRTFGIRQISAMAAKHPTRGMCRVVGSHEAAGGCMAGAGQRSFGGTRPASDST